MISFECAGIVGYWDPFASSGTIKWNMASDLLEFVEIHGCWSSVGSGPCSLVG